MIRKFIRNILVVGKMVVKLAFSQICVVSVISVGRVVNLRYGLVYLRVFNEVLLQFDRADDRHARDVEIRVQSDRVRPRFLLERFSESRLRVRPDLYYNVPGRLRNYRIGAVDFDAHVVGFRVRAHPHDVVVVAAEIRRTEGVSGGFVGVLDPVVGVFLKADLGLGALGPRAEVYGGGTVGLFRDRGLGGLRGFGSWGFLDWRFFDGFLGFRAEVLDGVGGGVEFCLNPPHHLKKTLIH